MKRAIFLLFGGLLLCGASAAQTSAEAQASASQTNSASVSKKNADAQSSSNASASANAGKNSASLENGTTMQAQLTRPLDASKNKPGDPVTAKTSQDTKSDGHVVIPKGSKLVGHVTEAKERAKGQSESSLGIVFDRAVLKDGREIPVHAVIQSIAAAQSSAAAGGDDLFASGSAMGSGRAATGAVSPAPRSGGLVSGATSTAGGAVGGAANTAGGTVGSTVNGATSATTGAAGTTATGALTSTSSGVIGLQGLALNSQAASASQGSLIVSSTRNVHLDSGTQMLLRTEAQKQ
jgi:hypothetical protein